MALQTHTHNLGPQHFRTLMFVKSTVSPEKIRSIPAEVTLILDLEDSIPVDQKARQRHRVRRMFHMGLFQDRKVILRVNGPDRPEEFHSDVIECLHKDLDGIMIPMVQSAAEVKHGVDLIQRRESTLGLPPGRISVIPLIERPGAVLSLQEIARSSERVAALAFGHVDYCVEMHSEISEDCYQNAQQTVLQVARSCQISAVSTVYLDLEDKEGFKNQNRRMKKMGFDGCFALTPKQAQWALEIFSLTAEEIAHARRVIAAVKEQGSIAMLDGEMVGPPMVKIAQRILSQAALGKVEVA